MTLPNYTVTSTKPLIPAELAWYRELLWIVYSIAFIKAQFGGGVEQARKIWAGDSLIRVTEALIDWRCGAGAKMRRSEC